MAAITNVNPQEMVDTAKNFKTELEQWDAAVKKIFQLQTQLDAMWDGTANDTFNAQWAEDRTKYDRLTEEMQAYCLEILAAAERYLKNEDEVNRIINS